MTCSPAQLAANKANAQRSSGPRSDAGKSRSSSNSMTHGLTAKILRSPEEEAAIKAKGLVDDHLASEVLMLTMRIEKAQEIEDRERNRASMRAALCWDEDRNQDANRVAKGLAKRPEQVASKLQLTIHGCTWMITRWEWLRDAASEEGGWTDAQQAQAFDLRGIPLIYRTRTIPPDKQAATAIHEITALQAQRTKLAPCDAFERDSARCGLSNEATPELRRVIRYEAALQRRLQWCLNPSGQKPPPIPVAKPAPVEATPEPAPADNRIDSDFESDFDLPAGQLPLDLPPAMGAVLPVSMIPPGSRAHVG